MSYLGQLTLRLAAGATLIPEDVRLRHSAYLAARQNGDGGFSGREGPSDLYYTSFALRGLALVGSLDDNAAARCADFLQSRLTQSLPTVDFLSLVYSAVLLDVVAGIDLFARAGVERTRRVAEAVEPYRREDGGYAKTEHGPHSSTYHTFLIAACKELIGDPLEEAPRMATLACLRRRDDGGFVELGPLGQSGTNPTAAAVGLLRLLGSLDDPTRAGAIVFLRQMQSLEGGLRANTRIPIADLLSTFTGLVALADLDALAEIDLGAVGVFVRSLEKPDGGFRGGIWDDQPDVEYTFYGLGTLALLASAEST